MDNRYEETAEQTDSTPLDLNSHGGILWAPQEYPYAGTVFTREWQEPDSCDQQGRNSIAISSVRIILRIILFSELQLN